MTKRNLHKAKKVLVCQFKGLNNDFIGLLKLDIGGKR